MHSLTTGACGAGVLQDAIEAQSEAHILLRLYVVHYWGSEREEMPRQGHGQICDSTSQLWGQSKGIREKKKIKGVVMKL